MIRLPKSIECGLVFSDVNRRYFTGLKSSAGLLAVTRKQSYLLVDSRYIEEARSSVRNCEVMLIDDIEKQLLEIFKKHQAVNIGVESEKITLSKFKSLCEKHNGFKFTDSGEFSECINKLRMIKSGDETGKIVKAQRIAEKAYYNILDFIKPGVSETDIALELYINMKRLGAEDISFETIAVSGKNSSKPHGVPCNKRFEEGDFVILDFGAVVDGYHSDMTRTIAVGYADDEMTAVYNTVLHGNILGIQNIKPGADCADIDKIVRNYINESGYSGKFGHGLGHGVGMEIHESPNLSPKYCGKLAPGNVITVEPGIYLDGRFGVRIEDMILVTENGYENLTECGKELLVL